MNIQEKRIFISMSHLFSSFGMLWESPKSNPVASSSNILTPNKAEWRVQFRKSGLSMMVIVSILSLLSACSRLAPVQEKMEMKPIRVSDNGHFFQTEEGVPFFWLGDTGWLLFKKLNRAEAEIYLEARKQQGFNVIQVMLIHELMVTNFQGDSALIANDISKPKLTPGNDPSDSVAYDYWDHVEYIVDLAAQKGLYMALVPVWGSPVSSGKVRVVQAGSYAAFLADRFAAKPNVLWLNGGDVIADLNLPVWETIGKTLDSLDTGHLITFHPRGRRMSSEWFHRESWLDFNMFQSGHRNYHQDTASSSHRFGPDNWRYVSQEYYLEPAKPTLDGEPSYEEIPQGLHDTTAVYWNAADLRRYAYWSVFAGGAGFTYGHNSVMQFYGKGDQKKAYGAKSYWQEAVYSLGARQMSYLKDLMLSKAYLDRKPDQSLVADQGKRYEYQVATRGSDYAFIYTYTGRNISVNMGKLAGEKVLARWYDPKTGETTNFGAFENEGIQSFDPPGKHEEGNDWVLILESA